MGSKLESGREGFETQGSYSQKELHINDYAHPDGPESLQSWNSELKNRSNKMKPTLPASYRKSTPSGALSELAKRRADQTSHQDDVIQKLRQEHKEIVAKARQNLVA